MTQAPATPELVERLRDERHVMQGDGLAALLATTSEAAAALEAQQARIAELEVENERLRLTMLGGEDVAGFASSLPLAQVLDSFRTYETALRDSANSAQALADRYEKALREIATAKPQQVTEDFVQGPRALWDWAQRLAKETLKHPRQALSSQGRHEGVTSGFIPELPGVNAVPLPESPDGPWREPHPKDLCRCGDYRHQHDEGNGRCQLNGLGHAGGASCLKFRLFREFAAPSPDNTNPKAGAPEHG